MKVTCCSETSVDFERTILHYIPEDISLHNHCCESLKSYTKLSYLYLVKLFYSTYTYRKLFKIVVVRFIFHNALIFFVEWDILGKVNVVLTLGYTGSISIKIMFPRQISVKNPNNRHSPSYFKYGHSSYTWHKESTISEKVLWEWHKESICRYNGKDFRHIASRVKELAPVI
jgi:hypothetical protein